ncbi:3'(2'),5'-bisphosphate nucleotidase CysQ [Alteromonas sp. 1_MG-2023]|uniref:3'(2'),5'-bisphosphate nucleotidase CysQ n=1 Tax=unclassified Alteromonas TaxID=2614992 RepID=UPI0026E2CC6D|nr:3'(2'),5'-bisphosphate nucleotidase CysQ [Alteromonas sp. 1_MG-2023]MDO6474262.1 3'(2'),5'-bisphosphate nucleotidase CysQ [Alteromonas sp. 1_MG-2023]
MPDDTRASLLEIAKRIAVEAGEAVLKVYDKGDFDAYTKDDESPVTSADYLANDIINKRLIEATPDIPILSEENKHASLAERETWERYWLIDPIDGTQEFIARSGDFAVNIALIENNEPTIGVIFWPPGQSLYYASKDAGAFKESPDEHKQIHVRKLDDPHESVVMIAISRRQSRDKVFSRMCAKRVYQTLPLGSCSLKSCFIAEGKADVFMRIGITGEWDTGASQCIVSEAGGSILAANFEPLTYNQRHTLENPDFVVLGDQRVPWQDIVQYEKGAKE